jgi:glycosyltransferase involved in cell wall biosynthesis
VENKIKILFGLEATGGGALKHVSYLIRNLEKEIFDITLIYSPRSVHENSEINELRLEGITIIEMKMPRDISLLKDMICLFQITTFLRKNRFDVVHAHSSKAGFYFRVASWLNNVPAIVYTPHCFFFQGKTGIKRSFFKLIEQALGYITDAIIVSVSERNQGLRSRIASENKFVKISNAIDVNDYTEYQRVEALKSLGLPEQSTVIGTIGRLEQQKDLITLIYAAEKLVQNISGLYFIIAGEGEQKDSLENEIIKLGLSTKVLLIGYQFNIDIIFSAIDIFVSTSLWEGLPYVILEAMFFKKPIVATNIGYEDILIDEESGYLISPRDVSSLCEKLTMLIKDRMLCKEMGDGNRHNFDINFSFKQFVSLHEQLYIKLYNAN